MYKVVTLKSCLAKFNNILIVALLLVWVSCSQHKNEGMLSKAHEKEILSEEIEDEILEHEAINARDLAKSLLNLDAVNSLKLKEIYLHEEPLAIIFLDQNQNMILFEAIRWSEKEIESLFENEKRQNNSVIRTENMEKIRVTYSFDTNLTRNKCIAIYNFGTGDVKLKMEIASESDIEGLYKKYSKLVKS